MFRLLTLAVSITPLLLAAPAAQTQHKHNEQFMKCAQICAECQIQCDSCFKHCLTMTVDGKKEHGKTAQFCTDCGECCKTCSTLCARQSPLAGPMLECCAKCCDECAATCEQFPEDKHMAACAKSCRDCAQDCREMRKHLGN